MTSFLQCFFIKTSSNFFTIQVTNNTSPRNCIFNFTNIKNFFWPIWGVSFSNNVFIFWNSNIVTNFKLRIFLMKIFIVFNIIIIRSVNRFCFNSSMNCVIVFTKLQTFWNSCYMFKNLFFRVLINLSATPDFPSLHVEYISMLFILKKLLKVLL